MMEFIEKLQSTLKHDGELLSTLQILSEVTYFDNMTDGTFPLNVVEEIMVKSAESKIDVLSISIETIEILKSIINKRVSGTVLMYITQTIDPMKMEDLHTKELLEKHMKVKLFEIVKVELQRKPVTKTTKKALVKMIVAGTQRSSCGVKKRTADRMFDSGFFYTNLENTIGKEICSELHQRMVNSCKQKIMMLKNVV
jgi:hypothetical protein